MPMFQDDLGHGREILPIQKSKMTPVSMSPPERRTITRKDSEESIRTDLCEGPVPDTPEGSKTIPTLGLDTSFKSSYSGTSDRGDLIERLKRGESSSWFPNLNVCESLSSNACDFILTVNTVGVPASWPKPRNSHSKDLESFEFVSPLTISRNIQYYQTLVGR